MLSQADISEDPNLVDLVKNYLKIKYQKPGNVYLGLIQRLDRPVGGIMVLGKTSKATSRLHQQMQAGEIEKIYLVVTEAQPEHKEGRLIHYLSKDSEKNLTRVYDHPYKESKKSILDFKVLANLDGRCLLKITLHTGRSHQIRAQLAAIDCPVFGDRKYGKSKSRDENIIALFSHQLRLIHPVTKEKMQWESLPETGKYWQGFYSFLNTR